MCRICDSSCKILHLDAAISLLSHVECRKNSRIHVEPKKLLTQEVLWEREMKKITFTAIPLLLVTWLLVISQPADAAMSTLDVVPGDAIACVRMSGIPELIYTVLDSPEWQSLEENEEAQMALSQVQQILPITQLLSGMEAPEFLSSFFNQVTFAFMGLMDDGPEFALIFDVQESIDSAKDAMNQLTILMSGGRDYKEMSEPQIYNRVSYRRFVDGNDNLIEYGFLENLMVIAVNGGFERVVDTFQQRLPSIAENPKFQKMTEKVQLSGNIYAYADLEKLIPLLHVLDKKEKEKTAEQEIEPEEDMEVALMQSFKAAAVKFDLSCTSHEIYLHVKPQGPLVFLSDILLVQHPPLQSIHLMRAVDGIFVGLHLGDLSILMKQLTSLAAMSGINPQARLEELEEEMGLDLEDDILSALTGEIGIALLTPEEELNLKENKLDIIKAAKPIFFLGIKDRQKFSDLRQKIAAFVSVEPLNEYDYKDTKIYSSLVAVDSLVPGVGLTPQYVYFENLLVASNSSKPVENIIDKLDKSSELTDEDKALAQSCLVMHADVGNIAKFFLEQDLTGIENRDFNLSMSEAEGKLSALTPIEISYAPEPEGIKLSIISAERETWVTKILRAVTIAILLR